MKKDRGIRMKEKVNVTGVPETMIQTLYARARESGKKDAKIKDDMAMEIVSKLDYDCMWNGHQMLPDTGKIFALVQY